MGVLGSQYGALEANIEALYEDWFIETCAPWVIPYIGDLLGIPGINRPGYRAPTERSLVANTIAYRRRKGVPSVVGRVVADATGWPAYVVQFFELLGATQFLEHVRPGKGGTIDLSDATALAALGTPFNSVAHTVDVRRSAVEPSDASGLIAPEGRFNLPLLGLFVWRLGSFPVHRGTPRRVAPGCYTFNPLGLDGPLFNPPFERPEIDQAITPMDLPVRLEPHALREEIRSRSRGEEPYTAFFGAAPAFQVFVRQDTAAWKAIPAGEIVICDLSQWQRPEPIVPPGHSSVDAPMEQSFAVAVDTVLGRLAFADASDPTDVEVNYAYGLSGALGAGTYARQSARVGAESPTWTGVVGKDVLGPESPAGHHRFDGVEQALGAWAGSGVDGILRIADNGIYPFGTTPIGLPPGRHLLIEACGGCRPCLTGDRILAGGGPGACLTLDGILIDGGIELRGGAALRIRHCTLTGGISSDGGSLAKQSVPALEGPEVELTIDGSIVGALRLPEGVERFEIRDSTVDGGSGWAISGGSDRAVPGGVAPGPAMTVERSTIFGRVAVSQIILASDVIFTEPVSVRRLEAGSLRFCYVPLGSSTPGRYRCQPDLALSKARDADGRDVAAKRINPSFTATVLGDPGYAQLASGCPAEIAAGGSGDSEMGVFHSLHQPQRRARVPEVLREYLPWGLEVNVVEVT